LATEAVGADNVLFLLAVSFVQSSYEITRMISSADKILVTFPSLLVAFFVEIRITGN